jgi:hypothetical protein
MRSSIMVGVLVALCAPAVAQTVFFGTLHSHTSYSDGSGTPDEAFARARDQGLDFLAITEHNHRAGDGKGERRDNRLIGTNSLLYAGGATSLVESADRANSSSFVAIYGQEVSTISQGNHINIFDVGAVVDDAAVPNGNVPALLAWMGSNLDSSGRTALLQFNHPRDPSRNLRDYGRDDFPAADWVKALDPFVELIEVLNAPALKKGENFRAEAKEGYFLEYLNLGFHVGPSVGHDNHWPNWGTSTEARVGVIASELSRNAILNALRARRTTASDDRNLRVIFRHGENIGGDIVAAPAAGSLLPLTVEISDPDEPDARYRVDVLSDRPGGDRARRPAESFRIEGNTSGRLPLEGILADGPGQFVLLRITQSGAQQQNGDDEHEEQEDRLWTAPIWFEAVDPATAVLPAIRIADLLPDPVGDDLVHEDVRIRNAGGASVDLSGWQLRDIAGNVWNLSSSLEPGSSVNLLRNRQAMSLNNDGDTIELLMPDGTVVDTVRYGRAVPGARMNPVRD